MTIDLTARVAIVTGAGRGLGRSHALELARRGAGVLVNDLSDGDTDPADAVVAEIRDAGGEAAAAHDDVTTPEGGKALVAAARDRWGRVDIVVNNAGILRTTRFDDIAVDELDAVMRVHLYGAFHVTMAAWPHLRAQAYGRVVMTSSAAGLYGNVRQAHYSAAKMGLVGLTRSLALEGQRHGIRCNAIAPLAHSRMTDELLPGEVLERLDPAWVSPLVAFLSSHVCDVNGEIFSAGGGRYARVAVVEGPGVRFDGVPDADDLAHRLHELRDVTTTIEPRSLQEHIDAMTAAG